MNFIYLFLWKKKIHSIQKTYLQVFEVLEKINPNFREKIVGISGDGTEPALGISAKDRLLLTNEVYDLK